MAGGNFYDESNQREALVNAGMLLLVSLLAAEAAAEQTAVSPVVAASGVLVHEVRSSYQEGTTQIQVLLPSNVDPDKKHSVVYVLPVEAKNESRYGDGLLEIKQQNLHEKYQAIFVAPTFSHLPWYCDHPTDPAIRQETYFLKVVVPFIDKSYPAGTNRDRRMLLGFSKSGWGAWSLLLRHPELFGRAAAWDAPMMTASLGKYGTTPIFGTQENFENYRISDLLRTKGNSLGSQPRLILTGKGNFQPEHERVHALMDELNVPHLYRVGEVKKHDWHSGWVPEAVELLLSQANQ